MIGAISACGLVLNRWSVDECIALSEGLAKKVFQPRVLDALPLTWIPSVRRLWQMIALVLLDAKYPSAALEEQLQLLFGAAETIRDHSIAIKKGQFLGFTLTTTEDVKTYLVTNYDNTESPDPRGGRRYNGDSLPGRKLTALGYELLKLTSSLATVPLWEL